MKNLGEIEGLNIKPVKLASPKYDKGQENPHGKPRFDGGKSPLKGHKGFGNPVK